jgi:tRNA-modifying protein YgfZ
LTNKFFVKNTGFIKASGTDLIDFLNRMSTNDLRKFPTDEFRKTILTTDKGRITDLINVFNLKDRQFILTSDNFQDKVISHLEKYIIMDDVKLERSPEKYLHIVITGDDLKEASEKLTGTEAQLNRIYKLNDDVFLFADDLGYRSLNIICKEENLADVKEKLKDYTEQSGDEYEFMRINASVPEGENEFNDNINPMECGLDKYISFKKGCYIGQEVIARLDSQGKRPKQMVKIVSEERLYPGEKIFTKEKETGFVSSSAAFNGKNSSLGFIRSVDLDYEKENKYHVSSASGESVKIKISKTN